MNALRVAALLTAFVFASVVATWNLPGADAQVVDMASEVTAEVDGADSSLALLEFVIANRSGQSCGAKHSKLVVISVDGEGGEVETTDQRSIPESDVLRLARSLPANENIIFLYQCEVNDNTFFARAVSISHVVYGRKDGWNANLMRLGNALDQRPPPPAPLDEYAAAYALEEASRQMTEALPKVSRAGARLDKLELADKTLLCDLILNTDASDVNERKFRRAMSKNITPTLCKDEKHLTIFRIGVHYEYRYRGKDGKEIATISVGSSDCE